MIIVRCSGERTEAECIRRARLEDEVIPIQGRTPFWKVLQETYSIGIELDQEWVPVVDADVLLYPNIIQKGIEELSNLHDVFCLDGRTQDKILNTVRRAGIHIYRRDLLPTAMQFVKDSIKPETRVRQAMESIYGKTTYVGNIIFGLHDYEQYYKDLYRTAYLQTVKLGKKIPNYKHQWETLSEKDDDYRVIIEAHKAGMEGSIPHVFDASQYYGAEDALDKLGLQEKPPYGTVPLPEL